MFRLISGRTAAGQPTGVAVPAALGVVLAFAGLLSAQVAMAGPGKRPASALPAPASQAMVADHAALGPEAALALALVGVPYRWGGTRPGTGLDCSGLVHHVFREIGVATPRDTRGLSRSGSNVARKDLQPGDLVFFNTLRRAYSHVGIYLGHGRFIHAPSAGSEVRIESMGSSYWRNRYDGARRLGPADDATPDAAQARIASSPQAEDRETPSGGPTHQAHASSRGELANPARPDSAARTEEIASYYRYFTGRNVPAWRAGYVQRWVGMIPVSC